MKATIRILRVEAGAYRAFVSEYLSEANAFSRAAKLEDDENRSERLWQWGANYERWSTQTAAFASRVRTGNFE